MHELIAGTQDKVIEEMRRIQANARGKVPA
jgi:hypothetical protein